MQGRPIVRSILITVLMLFLAQTALAAFVWTIYGLAAGETVWYLVAMPVLHVVVGAVLVSLRSMFVNSDTGERLRRVNFANVLSLVRLSSAPTVLWLVLLARTYRVGPVVVPLTALVFLTDLLDGQISRRTRQVTRIGRYLDSSSDYTVLLVVAVALVDYQLISAWLFTIVVVRLGLHLLGQIVLLIARGWRIPFRTSFLGKASVFAIMTLFAISVLRLIDGLPAWLTAVHSGAEYLTAAICVLSLIEKVYEFAVDAATTRHGRTRCRE